MSLQTYQQLHALATNYAGHKRGKKFYSNKFVRINPDNPQEVLIGSYSWAYDVKPLEPGQRYATHERLPAEIRPWITHITLSPEGALIHLPGMIERHEIQYAPEVLQEYPNISPRGWGPYKRVDIGLNNLLHYLRFGLRHDGAGDPKYPGFKWNGKRIAGRVFYDFETRELRGADPQPERVVSPLQKKVSNNLRAAFKKLRLLTRLGVEITADEVRTVLAGPNPDEPYSPTESQKLRTILLRNPEVLLAALEKADFTKRADIVDLAARFQLLLASDWVVAYPRPTMKDFAAGITRQGHNMIPENEADLARIRRVMHRKLDVVRYES